MKDRYKLIIAIVWGFILYYFFDFHWILASISVLVMLIVWSIIGAKPDSSENKNEHYNH